MVDFLINENDFYNYEQNEIIDKKENFIMKSISNHFLATKKLLL